MSAPVGLTQPPACRRAQQITQPSLAPVQPAPCAPQTMSAADVRMSCAFHDHLYSDQYKSSLPAHVWLHDVQCISDGQQELRGIRNISVLVCERPRAKYPPDVQGAVYTATPARVRAAREARVRSCGCPSLRHVLWGALGMHMMKAGAASGWLRHSPCMCHVAENARARAHTRYAAQLCLLGRMAWHPTRVLRQMRQR